MVSISDNEMTSYTPDFPVCKLSCRGDWTPLNQIFFSQCIQDSDDERNFQSQQKKKWKRKKYPFTKGETYRRYIVYESASSSESEVSTFDEFNCADHHQRNRKKIISDKPNHNLVEECDAPHYEGRVNIQDEESCLGPGVHISSGELDSADKEKRNVKIDNKKYCSEPKVFPEEPCISDEHNSADDDEEEHSAIKYRKYVTNKNDSSNFSRSNKRPQLSEYEKQVQKNRDEKIAMMKALKIIEAKENLQEAIKTLKLIPGQKKQNNKSFIEVDGRTKTKAHKEIVKVCRQSSRQKNLKEKKEEIFASSRLRDKLPSFLSFEEALKKDHIYHDFISQVSGSECKIPQLDSDYASHFEKMVLQESQPISSSAISSMAVHESQEKIIICAGDSNGEIIFWHVNSDYDFCAFQPHYQRVSCLKFHPYSPNALISSSVDGTMYHGDFEKKMFYQIFRTKSCNHFDFLSPKLYLVAHGIGYASIVDVRSYGKTFEKRHKCNEDIIKTVSVHPVNKNYFISSHQKGAVRLWDLRKLQNKPLMEVTCEGENLISSSFSPVTGNSVLVTMLDTICILDSSTLDKEFTMKKSIKYENFLNSSFQATWLPNTDDRFVIGSKLNPRRIEILDDKLCNVFNFTDKRLKVITPINVFHPSLPFLASASRRNIFIFSEHE